MILLDRTWKPTGISRKCGACTACCIAPPITELDKLPGEPCGYLCSEGCSIYDTRPPTCRGFACEWLWGMGTLAQRPDRMKAMPTPARHDGQLALYLLDGTTPDTLSREAERFIRHWHRRKRTTVICLHGEGYSTSTGIFPDGFRADKPTEWEGKLPPSMHKDNPGNTR